MEIETEEQETKHETPIPVRWDIIYYKRLGFSGIAVSQLVPASVASCNRIYRKWLETGNVIDSKK